MARKLPNPPRRNINGVALPPLLDCKPLKVKLYEDGKRFEPKDREVGSLITLTHADETISAQVWSKGPYTSTVWAVSAGVAYLVNRDDRVMETR